MISQAVATPGCSTGTCRSCSSAKDPAFLDEARKLNVPVNVASSREIETLLRDVYATPQPIVDRAAKIINDVR
jgi:hypothetical protein